MLRGTLRKMRVDAEAKVYGRRRIRFRAALRSWTLKSPTMPSTAHAQSESPLCEPAVYGAWYGLSAGVHDGATVYYTVSWFPMTESR